MSLRGSRNGAGLACLPRSLCCLCPREVPTNGTDRLTGVIETGGEAMTRKEQVDAVPRLTDDEWREVRSVVARIAERLDDMTTRLDVVETRLAEPRPPSDDRPIAGPSSPGCGEL